MDDEMLIEKVRQCDEVYNMAHLPRPKLLPLLPMFSYKILA